MVDGLDIQQMWRLSGYLRTRRNAALYLAGSLAGIGYLISLIFAL